MTLRSGIGFTGMTLVAVLIGSCAWSDGSTVVTRVEPQHMGCVRLPEGQTVPCIPAPDHLPTTCRPFYNDGTGRWIECMGVGLK